MGVLSFLRSDPSLKVASLALAVVLWLYVRAEEKPVQVFTVPLEVEGVPPELAVAGETPDSVAVRVRAPDSVLRTLTPERFHARIRLDGAKPGETEAPLTTADVRAPMGVEVLQVDPGVVLLRLERRIAREVPVVARIKGRAAAGYEYDGYTLVPDKVKVEGPEGVVLQVREAVTDEVDIRGRTESFETTVSLAPDRGGARIAGEGGSVLKISIRPERATRAFEGVPLTPNFAAGVGYHARFQPETLTVVLKATRQVLDGLGPANIRALLDLEGMNPREQPYSVKPRIVIEPAELGTQVAVYSVSEETINVRIER